MPDKEGDDEKKSTKSVVNKKQKQMMNQEDFKPLPVDKMYDQYDKKREANLKKGPYGDVKTGTKFGKSFSDTQIDSRGNSKQTKKMSGVIRNRLMYTEPIQRAHSKFKSEKNDKAQYEYIKSLRLGEEGYDHLRDMGKVRPSKDKKDATTMPVSDEVKKTQKVNKGPSAFELVKAKYGKSVMNVGKKKANEELDLSKVAEAFGGYIVEQTDQEKQKKEKEILRKRANKTEKPFEKMGQQPKDALDYTDKVVKNLPKQERPEPVQKAMAKDSIERQRGSLTPDRDAYLEPGTGKLRVKPIVSPVNPDSPNQPDDGTTAKTIGGLKTYSVNPETLKPGVNPTGVRKRGRPVGVKDKTQRFKGTRAAKDEVLAAMTPGQRERNLRQVKREIDAKNPTIQTQTGPVPYRNRRVATTSALAPQYDRTPKIMKPDTKVLNQLSPNVKTSFFQPTVGALPLTQTDTATNNIDPEIINRVRPKPTSVIAPEKEGPTIDVTPEKETETQTGRRTRTGKPTKTDIKKLKPPKIAGLIGPSQGNEPPTSDEPIADPIGGGKGGGKKTKVGNFSYRPGGAFSRIRGFARRNPALSLVGYDALKNFRPDLMARKGTRTGRRSAGQ